MSIVVLVTLAWASRRVLALPDAVPASAPPGRFSLARAFAHVEAIARAPHRAGSAENARVADYIEDQIRSLGLVPEIQQTVAVHPELGTTLRVRNVLVCLPGSALARGLSVPGGADRLQRVQAYS